MIELVAAGVMGFVIGGLCGWLVRHWQAWRKLKGKIAEKWQTIDGTAAMSWEPGGLTEGFRRVNGKDGPAMSESLDVSADRR